ncbi:hypothetical protein COR50_15600 [Chitinophaga caeni]|uniref:Lipoprotein n=1 Tax=Chitinophaga caeni TaxID=2029983 RepID=A0A291QX11_9BACT|nr:hypothetical protein [Chitinophaga caeni]ATL48470.1 hypothetical protein COR50_15600 [Chitinophaga caeni]
MKYLLTLCWLTFLSSGCLTGNKKENHPNIVSPSVPINSFQHDTLQLHETFNKEDQPINEYLSHELEPIWKNFKRVNSITKWTSIESRGLDTSTSRGGARYYFLNGQLEKIITYHFSETFQRLEEYYLLDDQLSFVIERSYTYNRPVYYDANLTNVDSNSQSLNNDHSGVVEDRSYFLNGKLIHQVNNEDCGSPFTGDYLLGEQKRIMATYEMLVQTLKQP